MWGTPAAHGQRISVSSSDPLQLSAGIDGSVTISGSTTSLVATVQRLCELLGATLVWVGPVDSGFRGNIHEPNGRAALERLLGRRNMVLTLDASEDGKSPAVRTVFILDHGSGVLRHEPSTTAIPAAGFALPDSVLSSIFRVDRPAEQAARDLRHALLSIPDIANKFLQADAEILARTLLTYPVVLPVLDALIAELENDPAIAAHIADVRERITRLQRGSEIGGNSPSNRGSSSGSPASIPN